MNNTQAVVRGARAVLAFHSEVNRLFGETVEGREFSQFDFNCDGGYFPESTYTAAEMLNVSNFSALNRQGKEIWMEVAVFLEENGIPLATVSSSLYEEPILFLVEKDRDVILNQIQSDLMELLDRE